MLGGVEVVDVVDDVDDDGWEVAGVDRHDGVSPWRDTPRVEIPDDDTAMLELAATYGLTLVEETRDGVPVWSCRDERRSWQPYALERRITVGLIRERVSQLGHDPRPMDQRPD